MRTSENKNEIKVPKVRTLKIQSKIRVNDCDYVTVPEIRLCGNWLEKLGFTPEHRVSVTAKNKMLVLTVEDNSPAVQKVQ